MPQKSTLLSTSEVAVLLQTTVSTINRWAASGRLRVHVQTAGVRGARLFLLSDVVKLRDQAQQDVAS